MKKKGAISLNFTGAATKGGGIAAAGVEIHKKIINRGDKARLKYASGISFGAVLGIPLILEKYEQIEKKVTNYSQLDFMDSVINREGTDKITFSAYWNMITKSYAASMDNLKATLRGFVSKSEFAAYTKDKTLPDFYSQAIAYKSGKRVFVNFKKLSYDDYLDFAVASSSIPIFSAPKIYPFGETEDFDYLYDSGVRDTMLTKKVMELHSDIVEAITIFSRPKNCNIADYTWRPSSIIKVIARTLNIMFIEISKSDELQADSYAREETLKKERNLTHRKIFLPSIMKSTYDVDKGRLRELWDAGKKAARLY